MLSEKLARPKPCRRCGQEIPTGTPLSALAWDRAERAWSHREPSCDVALGTTRNGSGGACPPADEPNAAYPLPGPGGSSAFDRGPADHAERGSWSVTVEFHESADPALSKRVLRIARLHLGTYEEAREVAEQLRKEV